MHCKPELPTRTERYRINVTDPKKNFLPDDFVPGDNDVLVGRGKKCYDHFGNKILRQLVKAKLKEYSASTCKYDKSNILSAIADQVKITGGNFVKEDLQTGKWYDVGDSLARDKISQTFRDALHGKYKSSTIFKTNKRREDKIRASISQFKPYSYPQIENLTSHCHPGRIQQWSLLDWRQNVPQYQNTAISDLELPFTASYNLEEEEELVFSSLNTFLEEKNAFYPMEATLGTHKVEEEDPFQPIPISKAIDDDYHLGSSLLNSCVTDNGNDSFEPIKLSLQTTDFCAEDENDHCLEPIKLEKNRLEPNGFPDCDDHFTTHLEPIELSSVAKRDGSAFRPSACNTGHSREIFFQNESTT